MPYNLKPSKDVSRATILAFSDASKVNEYTLSSSFTDTHPISMEHNRRLVNELIDKTFDEQKGTCEVSSSQCSSTKFSPSEYSYDKRLEYWKTVAKDRQKMSSVIQKQTKKNLCEILYNRLVTVDERDKFIVQNLMDYADRLNPTVISAKQPSILKEKCNLKTSALIPELQETLPLTERSKVPQIEITGLPKAIQKEILGKAAVESCKKPFSWLNSAYLGSRIEEKRTDIEHVLEYYPDTDNLQIVGEGLFCNKQFEHNSDIQLVSENDICKISTDNPFVEEVSKEETIDGFSVELPEYSVKINDQDFVVANIGCNNSLKTLTNFTCFPFETETKKIFTIQNTGRKVLDFQWTHCSFYNKNSSLLRCCDNEFVFDLMPFRLCSQEVREIFVKFQPRRVSIVKSKWILKVKPSFFKRKSNGIVMRLCGVCDVPVEYEQRLEEIQRAVIEKSNKTMMKKLTEDLGTLAAELQPGECNCPYQRSLNEMELFEQFNSGFKCERYNDLELLKELYKRAKKPRDKMWDLQVNTLKELILKIPQAEARALLFNELCGILNAMRGNSVDLETKISDNVEKDRCRFLYVYGIVATVLDEWVDLVETLEETFYQTILHAIKEEVTTQSVSGGDFTEQSKTFPSLLQDEAVNRQYLIEKRVRKLKPYCDALYMQTYTLLCDFVENVVNIIESTV